MKVSDFNYMLPAGLIAQKPLLRRDQSKLMVVDRQTKKLKHAVFSQLPGYLNPGDVLVLNDTRVIPARLEGVKAKTGGKVEVLLLNQVGRQEWEVLMRPARRLPPGTEVVFNGDKLKAVVEERNNNGEGKVRFCWRGEFKKVLSEVGKVPLPPYIHKPISDPERYQTVYGEDEESVASSTAGLHFTRSLLRRIEQKGVHLTYVTLKIGLDTFRPVRTGEVEQHRIHAEHFKVSEKAAGIINRAKLEDRRIIAVGTTSARAIEAAARKAQGSGLGAEKDIGCDCKRGYLVKPCEENTDLFIYPGYQFKMIDGMLTNFHLPRSTLLMMVAAFASRKLILDAYQKAIAKKYRFFSFGDAMLIV